VTGAENVLAGNCTVVLSTKSLPEEIKKAFASATKEPTFSLTDPGEPFQATDVYSADHPPLRRLIFAGKCDGRWFVYYEHGGRALNDQFIQFSNDNPPTSHSGFWVSDKANTLNELRSDFASGKFKMSENRYW